MIKKILVFYTLIMMTSNSCFAATKSLHLSEIMPNPKGRDQGNEWMEFYNNSNQSVSLENFQLTNGKKTQNLKGNIPAKSYFVLEGKSLKIALRNKNEAILLMNRSGEIIDKLNYGASREGMSFSKIDIISEKSHKSAWQWKIPTKNIQNPALYEIRGTIISKPDNHSFKIKTAKNKIVEIMLPSEKNPLIFQAILSENKKAQIIVEKDNSLHLQNINISSQKRQQNPEPKNENWTYYLFITSLAMIGIIIAIYKKS